MTTTAESEPNGPTKKVVCPRCGHDQTIPADTIRSDLFCPTQYGSATCDYPLFFITEQGSPLGEGASDATQWRADDAGPPIPPPPPPLRPGHRRSGFPNGPTPIGRHRHESRSGSGTGGCGRLSRSS